MVTIRKPMIDMNVLGAEKLRKRILSVRTSIQRARHVGIPRVGRYLYNVKRLKCKMGLYSGQEVAPNKWRYGWEYLGGPAKNYFTKATLNAHFMMKPHFGLQGDIVGVVLDSAAAKHATMIHGSIGSLSSYFYNPRLDAYVKTRPWMKGTRDEKEACIGIIAGAYGGSRAAAIAARQRDAILMAKS